MHERQLSKDGRLTSVALIFLFLFFRFIFILVFTIFWWRYRHTPAEFLVVSGMELTGCSTCTALGATTWRWWREYIYIWNWLSFRGACWCNGGCNLRVDAWFIFYIYIILCMCVCLCVCVLNLFLTFPPTIITSWIDDEQIEKRDWNTCTRKGEWLESSFLFDCGITGHSCDATVTVPHAQDPIFKQLNYRHDVSKFDPVALLESTWKL